MELNYTCLFLLACSLAVNIFQHVLIERYKKLNHTWRKTCQKWKETARNYEVMVERLIKSGDRSADSLAKATALINLIQQQKHDQ